MQGTLYVHPRWYDILHTPGTAADVGVIERVAARFLPRGRSPRRIRWLEPGCGTGRYLRLLARHGAEVVGLDAAREMIEYARERSETGPAALRRRQRYVLGDMRRFTPAQVGGRVDAAFCLYNTVRHMTTDAAMVDHLLCVGRALKPGGFYIVGTSLAEGTALHPCETVWSARRGGARVREVMQFEPVQRGKRWVERAAGVVVISRRGEEDECIPSVYDLWTGGVERWRRIVERAGMRELAVTDAWGKDTGATRGLYALRVLAPVSP